MHLCFILLYQIAIVVVLRCSLLLLCNVRSSHAHPDLISFSLLFYGFQGTLCCCADTPYSLLNDFFQVWLLHVYWTNRTTRSWWLSVPRSSGFLLVAAGCIYTYARPLQFFCLLLSKKKGSCFDGWKTSRCPASFCQTPIRGRENWKPLRKIDNAKGSFWIWYFTRHTKCSACVR